jgi:hypothetical protein
MGRHEDAIEAWRESYDYWADAEAADALDRGYREGGYAAAQERDQNMPSLAVDPIFDFLRDEPRFQALLDRLGLPG